MKKLVKRLGYAVLIFFGLYFFGDFEVNDVNIRDFLQQTVSPQQLRSTRNQIMGLVKGVSGPRTSDETQSPGILDQLSQDEQKKMMEIIKQNIDPEKVQEQRQELQKTLDKILKDSRREDQMRMMRVLRESLVDQPSARRDRPVKAPDLHKAIDKITKESL